MKRILNRLMLVAFAASLSLAATGCPKDEGNNDVDMTTPGNDGSATVDMTKKD